MAKIASDRNCGDCTACCDGWLKAEIKGDGLTHHTASPGSPCMYSSSTGCQVYESRPVSPCRVFRCEWLTNLDLPEKFKPNRSKVILKGNFVWERPMSNVPVAVATAVGAKLPGKTVQWLSAYAEENRVVVLCIEHVREGKAFSGAQRKYGLGRPDLVEQVRDFVSRGQEILIRPA